ncbi:hypothetical protein D3C87_1340030 [compost metagenome]
MRVQTDEQCPSTQHLFAPDCQCWEHPGTESIQEYLKRQYPRDFTPGAVRWFRPLNRNLPRRENVAGFVRSHRNLDLEQLSLETQYLCRATAERRTEVFERLYAPW